MTVEATVRWRRSQPVTDGSRARTAATESLREAAAERDRQQCLADAEKHTVIAPLRFMREQNHLADLFIASIERGRRRKPTAD